MSVTIKDVADLAGCSIATVSRYINGSGPLSTEARARIEAAVEELGYRPSEIGRSLRRRTARSLGVIVPSFTNPVFAESIAGFQDVARRAGYTVLVASTEYDVAREVETVESFLSRSVDGLALTVCDAQSSPALAVLDAAALPHVLLYNPADRAGRAAITVDNVAAAREMTGRLVAAGHRRVAFVAGRFGASDRSRLRYRGYAEALAEAGLAPAAPVEVDFLAASLDEALAPLLAGPEAATALFCSNDMLALAAIGAVRRAGLDVPSAISVVGFDGIALGRMVEPALTTIGQPAAAMGARAAETLFARLDGAPATALAPLPFTLLDGGSLAPAPPERTGARARRPPSPPNPRDQAS